MRHFGRLTRNFPQFPASSCRAGIVLAMMVVVNVSVMAQQVAGSVEGGLQTLAQEIVTKSVAQDRNSIAVLPFPNADGSCSVLSTYLADELIQALFAIPNSPLSIIERNQLEAIVNEIQIGAGGLLNPETTQSLGKVSGVKALTVGTITQIGDRVRINARLVATDTGRTISAAAVSIPRTNDIDSLLRQPVVGEGGTCGVRIMATSRSPQAGGSASPSPGPIAAASVIDPAIPPSTTVRSMVVDGLSIYTQSVTRSPDRKTVTAVVMLTNKSEKLIRAIMPGPKPSILDDGANTIELTSFTGLQACYEFRNDSDSCRRSYQSIPWTALNPNIPIGLVMRFQSKEAPIGDKLLNMTAVILIAPAKFGEQVVENFANIHDIPVTFSNLLVDGSNKK